MAKARKRMLGAGLLVLVLGGLYVLTRPNDGYLLGPNQKVGLVEGREQWVGDGKIATLYPEKPDLLRDYRNRTPAEIVTEDKFDDVGIRFVHQEQLVLAGFRNRRFGKIEAGSVLLGNTQTGWRTVMRFPYGHTPTGFFLDGKLMLMGISQGEYGVYSTSTGKLLRKLWLGSEYIVVPGEWPYVYRQSGTLFDRVDVEKNRTVRSWSYPGQWRRSEVQIPDTPWTPAIHLTKDAILTTTMVASEPTFLENLLIKVGLRKRDRKHNPRVMLADSLGNRYHLATLPATVEDDPYLEPMVRWVDNERSVGVRWKSDWYVFQVPDDVWRKLVDR